jgi:hypothetical protein
VEAGFKQAVRERDEPFGDFGVARDPQSVLSYLQTD